MVVASEEAETRPLGSGMILLDPAFGQAVGVVQRLAWAAMFWRTCERLIEAFPRPRTRHHWLTRRDVGILILFTADGVSLHRHFVFTSSLNFSVQGATISRGSARSRSATQLAELARSMFVSRYQT